MNVKKKKYDPDVWAPPTPTVDEKSDKSGKPMLNVTSGNPAGLSKFQQRFKNKAVVVSKDGIGAQLPSVQTEAERQSSVPHASQTPIKTVDPKPEPPRVAAEQPVLPPTKKPAAKKGKDASPPEKERPPSVGALKKNKQKVPPLDEPEIEAVQIVDAAAAAAAATAAATKGREGSRTSDLHTLAASPLRAPVTYIPPPAPAPAPPTEAAVPTAKPSKGPPQKKAERKPTSFPATNVPPTQLPAAAAGGTSHKPKQTGSAGPKRAPSAGPPHQKPANTNSKKPTVEEKDNDEQQPNYTPYTLEDYHQLVNEVPLPKSGGLGPNDTDEQREAAERKRRQMQYGLKASRAARETLQQEVEKQQQKVEEKRRSSAAEATKIYQEKASGAKKGEGDQADEEEEEGEEDDEDGEEDDGRTSEAFAPTPTSTHSSETTKHRPSDNTRKNRFSVFGPQKTKQSIAAQARRQKALEYARQVAPTPTPAAAEGTSQQRRRSSSSASHSRSTLNYLTPSDREAEKREQLRLDLEAKHDRNRAAVDLIRKQLNL